MAYTSTTNVGLRKTTVTGIGYNDEINVRTDVAANADTIEKTFGGSVAIGTNASIVNTAGNRIVKLYACSAGSISTITGMLTNVPFTLVMMSSGASLSLLNASPKKLSAQWTPNVINSNLTLVWDGTTYIEIGKVTTA